MLNRKQDRAAGDVKRLASLGADDYRKITVNPCGTFSTDAVSERP